MERSFLSSAACHLSAKSSRDCDSVGGGGEVCKSITKVVGLLTGVVGFLARVLGARERYGRGFFSACHLARIASAMDMISPSLEANESGLSVNRLGSPTNRLGLSTNRSGSSLVSLTLFEGGDESVGSLRKSIAFRFRHKTSVSRVEYGVD